MNLNEKGMVATVLMDLSKSYDCIPHNLLLAIQFVSDFYYLLIISPTVNNE